MQAGLIESELLTAAIIIDERGRAVATSNHMKPQHLADREYFTVHVAQDTGQLHISQPVHGRVSGRWTILMSRRINKPDGSFAGVVAIGVDPGYFTRFYGQTDLGRQGLATLVRLDGIVLAPRVGDALSFGQDISNSSLFVERANDPSGSIRTMGKLEGIRRFVGFRSLSEYPLVVAVGTAESEVLTSFHERRFRYTGVAALVSAAIAAFAGLLMFALARTRQTLGRSIQSEARLVQDIASRKRSEQALVESESRFRQVTKNIEDVLLSDEDRKRAHALRKPGLRTDMGPHVQEPVRRPVLMGRIHRCGRPGLHQARIQIEHGQAVRLRIPDRASRRRYSLDSRARLRPRRYDFGP